MFGLSGGIRWHTHTNWLQLVMLHTRAHDPISGMICKWHILLYIPVGWNVSISLGRWLNSSNFLIVCWIFIQFNYENFTHFRWRKSWTCDCFTCTFKKKKCEWKAWHVCVSEWLNEQMGGLTICWLIIFSFLFVLLHLFRRLCFQHTTFQFM